MIKTKLQIFEKLYDIDDETHLKRLLEYRHEENYGAFWLCRSQPVMGLFINNDKAWIYYQPESLTSCNPDEDASEAKEIAFLIENYQMDYVPESMTIAVNKAIQIFIDFYSSGELSNRIAWA